MLTVGAVVGLRIVLASLFDHSPFLLFLAAVMVASWFGGVTSACLATALAAVATYGLFLPENESPAAQYSALALFCAEGAIIGGLGAFLQVARRRAETAEISLRRDLLERTRIEQALLASEAALREANRRKDDFISMLSHELRTPLAALANAIALVRRKVRTPEVLALADRQIQRLTRMTDELLDVSRITRGKVVLHCEPLDIASVVANAIEATRPLLEARRHRLVVTLPPEPITLFGDRVRLEQVLGNLLDNAAKYTDDGGQIEVGGECIGNQAVIRVRDTGMGMSPEELPHVFDVFVQGERSFDRSGGGLGIGLSVVRSLVDTHGGHVEAHSRGQGHGSEFVVTLPLTAQPLRHSRSPVTAPVPDSHRRRVLLVDDNPDVLRTMILALTDLGYDVQGCDTGEVALQIAVREQLDAILLDVGLPDVDGRELARRLRQHPTPHPPLLIGISGYGRIEDRLRAAEAGFDEYLAKPIDPGALHALLRATPVERQLATSPHDGGSRAH